MIDSISIFNYSIELGFDDCGITKALISTEDTTAYSSWLSEGKHGFLRYMEKQGRTMCETLLEGAQTAIIFVSAYKQPYVSFEENTGLVASYARGKDYHNVHRARLKRFSSWFEEKTGHACRPFSDSAPILEKALAVQAGLGTFGKNTLVIHPRFGSFILLSGILTTLRLPSIKRPTQKSLCGTCTRCLDACPTQALNPFSLDVALCLSAHTIEKKDGADPTLQKKNPGYVFGCDICQDVCPFNARTALSSCSDFSPAHGLGALLDEQTLSALDKKDLYGTPLKRRGIAGLKQNLSDIIRS